MKKGDCIRTDLGEMAKVTFVDTETFQDITGNVEETNNEIGFCNVYPDIRGKIINCRSNIIDLIEIEDIVNGYRILNIVNLANSDKKVFTICKSDFKDICRVWGEEDIETILTKEQYNKNCYKVKGE